MVEMINRTENLSKSNQTKQEAYEYIMYIRMRKELGRERKVGYPDTRVSDEEREVPFENRANGWRNNFEFCSYRQYGMAIFSGTRVWEKCGKNAVELPQDNRNAVDEIDRIRLSHLF